MKRILVVILALGMLGASALGAEDVSTALYDRVSDAFSEMLDVLDQAITLATLAIAVESEAYQRSERHDYTQAVLNLLEGPDSDLYNPENPFSGLPTIGLIPLMNRTRSDSGGSPVGALFPEAFIGFSNASQNFVRAWEFVNAALEEASSVAQGMIRPVYDYPWKQELAKLYSLLIAIRGGDLDDDPLGGVRLLSEIVPSREIWVEPGESIQAAIDRIPVGGTVHIAPGRYKESLRITKSVTLASSLLAPHLRNEFGLTVLEGSLWRASIEIVSEGPIEVSIRGLVMRLAGAAVVVDGPCRVELNDVRLEGNDAGVFATNGAQVEVVDSEFSGNKRGVIVRFGAECALKDCEIAESEPGGEALSVVQGRLELVDCTVRDNPGIAIRVFDADSEIHLVNCNLIRNVRGLELHGQDCVEEDPSGGDSRRTTCYPTITGWSNRIPDQGEPDENSGGAYHIHALNPDLDLSFLTEPEPDTE